MFDESAACCRACPVRRDRPVLGCACRMTLPLSLEPHRTIGWAGAHGPATVTDVADQEPAVTGPHRREHRL